MFKILYSYSGWQNVNYVMNDVKNPVRTLKIAGPLALGITAMLYIFANIAYFAYVRLRYIRKILSQDVTHIAHLRSQTSWSPVQQLPRCSLRTYLVRKRRKHYRYSSP